MEIEAFLKRAMHKGNVHNMAILFAGKLATKDVPLLTELQAAGLVQEPTYLPAWIKKQGELAAHLAFNDITERFRPARHKS